MEVASGAFAWRLDILPACGRPHVPLCRVRKESTLAAWSSARLSCGPVRRGESPLSRLAAVRCGLKMRAVDHHAFGRPALGRKVGEDSVKIPMRDQRTNRL
jgi:hypothetical protein